MKKRLACLAYTARESGSTRRIRIRIRIWIRNRSVAAGKDAPAERMIDHEQHVPDI